MVYIFRNNKTLIIKSRLYRIVNRRVIAAYFSELSSYYTRHVGKEEIAAIEQTGLLRGGRPGRTYFTIDHYFKGSHAINRLSLEHIPEYRVDFEILNQPSIKGPERVAPLIPPFKAVFREGWGIQYRTWDPVRGRVLRIQRME
jgi:hypothetical protein